MENLLRSYNESLGLFAPQDAMLLAISGGVDSVVLLHLLDQLEVKLGLAHCNFRLRGAASDEDEVFIKTLGEIYDIPVYTTQFDTEKLASAQKIGIQELARDLRYAWLEDVRVERQFDWIATAHHLNDSIETAIYNWAKGTGIQGLLGVPPKNGHIIRPLGFATKSEIEQYAKAQQLSFRFDASNASDKYARNKIRHHVIPALKSINPSLEQTIAENLANLKGAQYWMNRALEDLKKVACRQEEGRMVIDLLALKEHTPGLETALFTWLSPYGFNKYQIQDLINGKQTGIQVFSQDYVLLLDRNRLILEHRGDEERSLQAGYTWHPEELDKLDLPKGTISASLNEGQPKYFDHQNLLVHIDAQHLMLPLKLRYWLPGDDFAPLGLKGKRQKIKSFLTSRHVDRLRKQKTLIMEDAAGEICWILGHQISESCKIQPHTKQYWTFHYKLT